jgi:hypothetical protein
MKECVQFGLKLNTAILHWYQHTPEEKDEEAKGEFYSSLEKVSDAVPNFDKKTVLGDFSAEAGKVNGKRKAHFCTWKRFSCDGNIYQCKDIHKDTWRSSDKKYVTR